jgi:hypothetical protein
MSSLAYADEVVDPADIEGIVALDDVEVNDRGHDGRITVASLECRLRAAQVPMTSTASRSWR